MVSNPAVAILHPNKRGPPIRRRSGTQHQQGTSGVTISVRSHSSQDITSDEALGWISGMASRTLPLLMQWVPYLAMASLGVQNETILQPWSKGIGVFLCVAFLTVYFGNIPEISGIFSLQRVSASAIFFAGLAIAVTRAWSAVTGDKILAASIRQVSFSEEDTFQHFAVFQALCITILFFIGDIFINSLAEDLLTRSWLYRETLHFIRMGKEGNELTDFRAVQFSDWEWYPVLQSCAAIGTLSNEFWATEFLSAIVFQVCAYWTNSFISSVHARWLYKLFNVVVTTSL